MAKKDPNYITKEEIKFALQLVLDHQMSSQDYNILVRAWQMQELKKEQKKQSYAKAKESST